MPGNFKKDDLRIIRTYEALMDALSKLLQRRKFRQLTVNDLCEEARLSRTAFYAHFRDKYDLLERWLANIISRVSSGTDNYAPIERLVSELGTENHKLMKNLFEDTDSEMLELFNDFFSKILIIKPEKNANGKPALEYITLTTFCTGGIINNILWQINNNFPLDARAMKVYTLKLLNLLLNEKNNGY